ncbi:RICIN domain-containing protein [Nonomuraea glycinis]|uniref:RICIN domain-containing protein n=1 Tax=Nonomuraea glycinis TaxID=2047744 RepID=UPI0033AD8278
MPNPKTYLNAISAAFLFFVGLPPTFAGHNHQPGPRTSITAKWMGWPLVVRWTRTCSEQKPVCLNGELLLSNPAIGPGAQSFFFDHIPGSNKHQIKIFTGDPRLNGKLCLDVQGFRTDSGAPVIVWPCHGGSNQQWQIETYYKGPNKGITRLVGVGSGKCLDLRNPNVSLFFFPLPPHLTPIQIWDCFPDQEAVWWSKNQSWVFGF